MQAHCVAVDVLNNNRRCPINGPHHARLGVLLLASLRTGTVDAAVATANSLTDQFRVYVTEEHSYHKLIHLYL